MAIAPRLLEKQVVTLDAKVADLGQGSVHVCSGNRQFVSWSMDPFKEAMRRTRAVKRKVAFDVYVLHGS